MSFLKKKSKLFRWGVIANSVSVVHKGMVRGHQKVPRYLTISEEDYRL